MNVIAYIVITISAFLVLVVINVVISSRQVDHYLSYAAKQYKLLLSLTSTKSPIELDQAFFDIGRHSWLLTPRARRLIKQQLWSDLGQQWSKVAVKQWRDKSIDNQRAKSAFAIHNYIDNFGLSEVLADAGVYEKLPKGLRQWLASLDGQSHLNNNLRAVFFEHLSTPENTLFEKAGEVSAPFSADIYVLAVGEGDNQTSSSQQNLTPSQLREQWLQYHNWLSRKASGAYESLNPGIDQHRLDQYAHKMGIQQFPASFITLYQWHNGQAWDAVWCFPEGQWMPIEQVFDVYTELRKTMSDQWSSDWIPFLFDGGSSYFVINAEGRILNIYFEESSTDVVATSLEEWLTTLNNKAQNGMIMYDESAQMLIENP